MDETRGLTYVDRIIAKFGGLSATSRALGHENPSTVQGWKERGVIPARQQSKVLEAARALEIAMSPADFFDPPEDGQAPFTQGAAA